MPGRLRSLLAYWFTQLTSVLWRRTRVPWFAYAAIAATVSYAVASVGSLAYLLLIPESGAMEPPTTLPTGWLLVFTALVWAPVIETPILAVIVGVARWFTQRETAQVIAGAVPMGLGHAVRGAHPAEIGAVVFVTMSAFLVFSLVYVAWRRTGLKEALAMCAIVHALNNALVLVAGPLWG
jgi:hypothetical protein